MAFFSFFAACRFFFGPGSWLLAGSMMTLVALTWPPLEPMGTYMSIGQSFAPSAAAMFAGLLVLGCGWSESQCPGIGPGRLLVGLVLLCVSLWVNIGMFLTALPLTLGACFFKIRSRPGGWRQARNLLLAVGFVVLALAVNLTLTSYYNKQYSAHDYSILPVSLWPESLACLAANFIVVFYPHTTKNIIFLCMAAVSCIPLFTLWIDAKDSVSPMHAVRWALCLVFLAAMANYIFYGTNAWVRINHYEGRYLVMVYFLMTCFLCGSTAIASRLLSDRGRTLVLLALIVIIPLISWKSYGFPAVSMLEMGLEQRFGQFADEVLGCRCTHVAGTYWKVWPIVFYSNVKLHRNGGGEVWGVSYRSDNTAGLWTDRVKRPWRVCAFRGDPQADEYILQFGLMQAERVEIDGPLFEH